MAGLALVLRNDGREDALSVATRMTGTMEFRALDGVSHWNGGCVALGHCRTDVCAEASEGSQPCVSEDSELVLAMDGYISNWHELRQELLSRGARLRNRSDAELFLHAYDQWGEQCGNHVDGEFSVVLWDERLKAVFCVRDHHGLRPLYYCWDGSTFLAATDIRALHAAQSRTFRHNRGYIAEVMANRWYSRDQTVWEDILRLPSAHSLSLRGNKLERHEYWKLPTDIQIRYRSDREYFEHYRDLLSDCVRRVSRSSYPLAFEVSGGLDSSAVFAIADRLQKEGQLLCGSIKGYCLAGDAGSQADELHYSRLVGSFLGQTINEVPIFAPGVDWFARQSAEDHDMAMYPNGAMSVGLEQAAAADGCRAIVTGHGGDQWLDGSPRYYDELLRSGELLQLIRALKEDIGFFGVRRAIALFLRNAIGINLPVPVKSALRTLLKRGSSGGTPNLYWLSQDLRHELAVRRAKYEDPDEMDGHASYKLDNIYNPFLPVALDPMERQRAKSGLESRSPMLSRAFIEFCSTTPERIRLRGGTKKFVHRKAMEGLLPPEVCERPTKAYFDPVFWKQQRQAIEQCELSLENRVFGELVDSPGLRRMLTSLDREDVDSDGIWEIWGSLIAALLSKQPKIAPLGANSKVI